MVKWLIGESLPLSITLTHIPPMKNTYWAACQAKHGFLLNEAGRPGRFMIVDWAMVTYQ